MATQYTPILQLALPVTGELNGTWGDVVNNNITSMVEEAIAGMATISIWTANSHTLTTSNGATDEARCAMLSLQTGTGGTALTGVGTLICPALTKLYVVSNQSAYQVTIKTATGTGIAVAAGDTTFVFCDGTNVLACVTQITNGHITGNLTVDGNANIKGNTTLGDASVDTVTINAGTTTVKTGGAIRFEDNAGGEYVALKAPAAVTTYTLTLPIDDGVSGQALITDGSGNLSWSTAASGDVYGPASATNTAVALFDGVTGKLLKNSGVTVDGSNNVSGVAQLNATTVDLTNLEVTNIKAKDGTQAIAIADTTGALTLSSGTANGVAYLNGSKVLTTGSALTFDGSNLGLGVTPSAWDSFKVMQIGSGAIAAPTGSANTAVTSNAYWGTGTWRYVNTLPASLLQQVDGMFTWKTAPSGTAGNAISFTQAMTLDASGNLGIGTSSPAYPLDVLNYSAISNASGAQKYLYFRQTTLQQPNSAAIGAVDDGNYSHHLQFFTKIPGTNNSALAERMRIDSDGNVLVGTTTLNGNGFSLAPSGSAGGVVSIYNRPSTTSTTYCQIFRNGGSDVGYIAYTNTTTTYSTSSDYRLKENIQPMQNALAVVQQLNPVRYTWKADGSDGQGFIAHELQAVVPDCVTGDKDAVDKDGKPVYQGIDTSFLVATLTAAIKELKAELDATKAEVAALKGV